MELSLRQSCRLTRAATVALRSLSSSATSDSKSLPDVFRTARRGKFFQAQPELRNPFIEDPYLRACLVRLMPPEVRVNASYNFADSVCFMCSVLLVAVYTGRLAIF